MSSPPPVTTPGSNVTPMWGGSWPGRPPASPPSCFSQLYGLNQCYDDIIMMKQILAKVVCDLATNDPAFQQCLAEGIAKSGSAVPLIGVTNGTDAQPGQVGEWVQWNPTLTFPATTFNSQLVVLGTLPAGDWDCFSTFYTSGWTAGTQWELNPEPAGFSSSMTGATNVESGGATLTGTVGLSVPARALTSGPSVVAFTVGTNMESNAAATATTGFFFFQARRAR